MNNNDPNVYLCEDFEVNGGFTVNGKGKWYAEDADRAIANGGINARTKGWRGTIFANPITPDGAEICGVAVPAGSCAGNHGLQQGATGGINMADHSLMVGEPGSFTPKNHVFIRFYQKFVTGYQFGQEKVLTFNRGPAGVGGIYWGNIHLNCGGNSEPGNLTGVLQWQPKNSSINGQCYTIGTGTGNGRLTSGVWYAIQTEIKLGTGTTDGYLRFYLDNCGANGDQCSGTPTLRTQLLNISFNGAGTDNLGSLWWENWANNSSVGYSYIDQIVVRDGAAGLIPFVSASAPTPPAAPTNVRVAGVTN